MTQRERVELEKANAVFCSELRCCLLSRSDPWSGRGFGACTRIRTRDQLIKSQLLYQLSYAGAPAILSSLSFGLPRSATCRDHPPAPSTRASMIARLYHLFAGPLRVHHAYLEEVLELTIENFDQP